VGFTGFLWKWEYYQPWDGNGNKTYGNGNLDVGVGKNQAIATYFCAQYEM